MKHVVYLLGLILLMMLVRCGQSNGVNKEATTIATLPDTLALAYQDTVLLSTEADRLSFDRLVHDSRCPTGATCVWEGSAEVQLALYQDGTEHLFSLHTHPTFTNDTTLSDLTIALLDLTPYPHTDSSYRADQYTISIYVTR